jgi:hypothetical protein
VPGIQQFPLHQKDNKPWISKNGKIITKCSSKTCEHQPYQFQENNSVLMQLLQNPMVWMEPLIKIIPLKSAPINTPQLNPQIEKK